MIVELTLLALSLSAAAPQVTENSNTQGIQEIRSREVIDLLAGVSSIYQGPAKAGFVLRAFVYRGEGECSEETICSKDRFMVLASTFDEYPEKRAFQTPIMGAFRRVVVKSVPKKEGGSFALAVYSEVKRGKESCTSYVVTLQEMRLGGTACR